MAAASSGSSKQFPLFNRTQPMAVILQEGDALFIPNGYWHAVESLSIGISVTVHAPSFCEEISTWIYDAVEKMVTQGLLPSYWTNFCVSPLHDFFEFQIVRFQNLWF